MRPNVNLTRRSLLAASAGLFVPRWTWAKSREPQLLCWKLGEAGDNALESESGTKDPVTSRTGHALWVGKGRDRALRLDGYSVWINHPAARLARSTDALSISAWLALESYPVNDAAIIEFSGKVGQAIRFSIDKWGFVQLEFRQGIHLDVCRSAKPASKGKWVHLGASLGGTGGTIYIDGVAEGRAEFSQKALESMSVERITLGRSVDTPLVAGVFPTGVLNGLLRDLRVFNGDLSPKSIAELQQQSKPDGPPDLQINAEWCEDDPHRPEYHALPPRAWTNEPHGLIHWRGQYHLFYQKNPNGPYWEHINWGHMTSPDMYVWTEMPVALSPEPGPDAEGCWSGSVVGHNDELALIYTGGDSHRSSICLALSSDGIHFTKFKGNPIIPEPPLGMNPEFRDPFVWREGDTYYLIIGSAVKDVGGTALLYRSRDLISWEYRKPILLGDRESSGVFWEMPVFVKIGSKHALIVCEVPGRASYWVGTWQDETFTPNPPTPRRLELLNHMLSPTPMIDEEGRVITTGIVPDERSSKECWRAGWAHLYSLPRVLTIDTEGHLRQGPHEGIDRWQDEIVALPDISLQEGSVHTLENVAGLCRHVDITFKKGESHSVSLLIRRAPNGKEQTELRYEWEIGRLTLDRSRSSLDPEVKRDAEQATYFPTLEDSIRLNVYLDHSVIEVFVDDRSAFASRIYPTLSESETFALSCVGRGAEAVNIKTAKINRKPKGSSK